MLVLSGYLKTNVFMYEDAMRVYMQIKELVNMKATEVTLSKIYIRVIMIPVVTLIFILLNLYFIVCSYSTNVNLFLVLITFHIVHLFLSLILILILLTLFAHLTCLMYYIGC